MSLSYPVEQKEINVEPLHCYIFRYKTLGGFCASFVLSMVNIIIEFLTIKRLLNIRTHIFVCGKKNGLRSYCLRCFLLYGV